jgi:hypothetical protein
MGTNADQTVNLWKQFTGLQDIEVSSTFSPRLNGMTVSSMVKCIVRSKIAPIYVQRRDKETQLAIKDEGVWYCLATHEITITAPHAIKGADGKRDRTAVRLGDIRVTIEHDDGSQPLNDPKYARASAKDDAGLDPLLHEPNLTVQCIAFSPGPTASSQEVSNSVSEDFGANVGIFGFSRKSASFS